MSGRSGSGAVPRRGHPFSLRELAFLASASGADALAAAERLGLTEASLLADLTLLRRRHGEFSAAVAETVRLRRRAVPKFGAAAAGWLLTEVSLQQGTPHPVAAHRAARLAGLGMHDLTCSIGADLVALSAVASPAVGSDLDPVRVAMAAHNLAATGLPARVFVADALTPTSRGLLGYADPARRDASGRRVTSADVVPSVAELDAVYAARPPVLRLPPGIDYQTMARPGEVEVVSLDGAAREAVFWPPELARVDRRATVLGGAGYQLTSADPEEEAVGPADDWLVDPDPAVVRSGLVRQYAARHGLHRLDEHLAYLTGPVPPADCRAFRVLDSAPFRDSTVAGWIRRDGVGTLEIKQRGTPVIPDELRRRVRPALSPNTAVAATLVVARIGHDQVAYWCRAVDPRVTGVGP